MLMKMKQRSPEAVSAHFRNSGGAMHDKRAERQGARNEARELLEEYQEYLDIQDELGSSE
mgnify:CR=1 FL=1